LPAREVERRVSVRAAAGIVEVDSIAAAGMVAADSIAAAAARAAVAPDSMAAPVAEIAEGDSIAAQRQPDRNLVVFAANQR